MTTLPIFLYGESNTTKIIQNLESRIVELEKQQTQQSSSFSASSTTIKVGGRIALDTLYLRNASGQSGGSNNSDYTLNADNIPLDAKGEKSELSLSARNSKFWVKTRSIAKSGKAFQSLLEFDFWGTSGNELSSNSHNPRLRHAYFTYNGWTVGQTNTIFMSSLKPTTVNLPVDDIVIRQPLISYQRNLSKGNFILSLEQPESVIQSPTGEKNAVNDDQIPDIILKYQSKHPLGAYSLALLSRQIRIDQELESTLTEEIWGYGINLNAQINLKNNDTITLGITGGKGIGRYLASGFFPDATLINETEIKAQTASGGHIGYAYPINQNLSLNSATGYVTTQNNFEDHNLNKAAWSTHVSLRYSPLDNFLLSAEFVHAERILQNSQSASIDRLYLQASYNF